MDIRIFTDLIDALGKVASGLKAVLNLPKAEREAMRQTLDETYRLIDTTLNMVIIRLGDIALLTSDAEFCKEASRLDNYEAWVKAEREFRLCRSLRVALRETESLVGRMSGAVSIKDWNALLSLMRGVLATEGEVALFIGGHFQRIAGDARTAGQNAQDLGAVRGALATFRAALLAERQQLITQETELYTLV